MERDVMRQRVGQGFRLRPLPSFYTKDGDRLPFRDDLWVLRHVSEDAAEFRDRHTGAAVKIVLADLEEIRIPDYLIVKCDIVLRGDKASAVRRKETDQELLRRVKRSEDTSKR